MKRLLQSYISFTRTERMGLIGLLALLVVLITIRFTMHLCVKPSAPSEKEKQLLTAWQDMQKRSQPTENTQPPITPASAAEKEIVTTSAQLFPFDPNTLDSAGFRKLGLREKTTSNLLHWRAKGKRFYKKEDLKPLYTLTEAEYNRLAPYITIKIEKINLNTADSLQLIALKGIGPKLAHRILERRRTEGNFSSFNQLLELYSFPDSTFSMLKQQLFIK